ncbi:receptor-like protein Cf-9 homolog [Salvia hispanica]|uniref:receptor-like protein Cf-9 homolog n=1 Tax=Salvia hispanica TaxID=49212 RepID=UPI002009ABB3|nr:receptor-like protein Cf-9 homolog [Salvia hispanica]
MTSLRRIGLEENNLTGPIPKELGSLVNLWELQLKENYLINGSIPKEFGNLTSLSYLLLYSNKLTGHIPKEIGSMTAMRMLLLQGNNLNGPIPSTIGNMSELTTLLLFQNKLSGEIPSSICNLRLLSLLHVADNHLEGPIPKCLGNINSSLWLLNLGGNQITALQSTFAEGCSLQALTLNGNKLEGIPHSLINCQRLQSIDVGDNEIRGAFPFWMERFPQLRVLILRSNKLNGTMLEASKTEHPFPKLQVLDIARNDFVGSLPDRYFKNFGGMIDAKENLTRDEKDALQEFIDLSFTLKGLDQTLRTLLDTFTTIDFSSNKFSGNIPVSIGTLNSLRYLNLSHNTLTGQIPVSLGNISLLESLDLSWNRLGGKIPSDLTGLTFLSKLNLSMNNLVGQIPQSTQFSTFQNDSYVGNLGLCGVPLTKQCETTDGKPMFPQEDEDKESGFIDGFGWQSVVMGYGCGCIVGIGIGYMFVRSGRPRWLVDFFFGMDIVIVR